MLFYGPKLLYPYYSLLLFFHFSFTVYRLLLLGWGLRTDRVYITLSQPCTADLLIIIIIIIINYWERLHELKLYSRDAVNYNYNVAA